MSNFIKIMLVGCLTAVLLSGCARKNKIPPPLPTQIDAIIVASDDLNPDLNARPSPIVIRVYQLKTIGAFDLSSFDSLYNNDKAILADDLVHRDEFHLTPGQQLRYNKTPLEEVKYLAVIGAYRNINHAVWKKTIEIPAHMTSTMQIQFNQLSIDILNNL